MEHRVAHGWLLETAAAQASIQFAASAHKLAKKRHTCVSASALKVSSAIKIMRPRLFADSIWQMREAHTLIWRRVSVRKKGTV